MRNSHTGKTVTGEAAENLLWIRLTEAVKSHSMMGCSAMGSGTEHEVCYPEDVPCGIYSGHAYSIIDAFSINAKVLKEQPENQEGSEKEEYETKPVKLVRLRNPWGKKEWNGKFSDGSEELNDNLKLLNAYVRKRRTQFGEIDKEWFTDDQNDGTFLMPFKDWW